MLRRIKEKGHFVNSEVLFFIRLLSAPLLFLLGWIKHIVVEQSWKKFKSLHLDSMILVQIRCSRVKRKEITSLPFFLKKKKKCGRGDPMLHMRLHTHTLLQGLQLRSLAWQPSSLWFMQITGLGTCNQFLYNHDVYKLLTCWRPVQSNCAGFALLCLQRLLLVQFTPEADTASVNTNLFLLYIYLIMWLNIKCCI